MKQLRRFPPWLKKKYVGEESSSALSALLRSSSLSTVCQSARCPNLGECFKKGRATFLILGNICVRSCRFCGIKKGSPLPVDKKEPKKIAELVVKIKLDHVIITSVTRDDLDYGGAKQFADCVYEIRKHNSLIKIEILTPDFKGSSRALKLALKTKPDVFAHNIETVPRLYKKLRPEANYNRSLDVLKKVSDIYPDITTKSGIMVGLGENEGELYSVMADLRNVGCSVLTIGQYLRPSKKEIGITKFIQPSLFEKYKKEAMNLGFKQVASGPFVRSSYVN